MHSRLFCAVLTAACVCAQARRPAPKHDANTPNSQASTLKPGTIDGTTINSFTNTPVKKAVVSLRNTTQNFSYIAASDASGHFQFPAVEPGTYMVQMASVQGFSYLPPSRDKLAASQITVAEDGHVTGINVLLRPLGVITGKVVDDDGEPLQNVNIQALRWDYSRGPRSLMPTGNASTDDRGEYRIYDIQPGRYFLRASAPAPAATGPNVKSDIAELGYPATFYPGGSDPTQATRPEVTPGGEAFGIDFRMHKVPVYHVRGRIENAPENGRGVQAQTCGEAISVFPIQFGAPVQPDGRFDLGGLTPGTYCINYSSFNNGKNSTAHQTVTISDQSVNGLSLTVLPVGDIQGVVLVEGNISLSTPGQQPMRLDLQPANGIGRFANTVVKDDGTFKLPDISAATYRIGVNSFPMGTYVKSLEYGEQDVSDGMVDITGVISQLKIRLGSDGGQLNTTVLTEKGDPAANALVNIIPQGRMANRRDLRRTAASDQNGKLKSLDLAPGDYRVVAMDTNDTSVAFAEDFIVELGSRAPTVTVHSGGNESVEVKVIPAEEVDRIKSKL